MAMSHSDSIDIHEAGLALNLPDLIFETRAGAGMNQEQLAHALGTTREAVAAWESGDEVPRVDAAAPGAGVRQAAAHQDRRRLTGAL